MKKILNFSHSTKIALIAGALMLGACGQDECVEETTEEELPTTKKKEEIVPVVVQALAQSSFQNEQSFFATAKASSSAQLIARQGGKVNSVKVQNGQWVKKGKALCDIDAEIHKTNMELAKAQYQLAETEYKRLQEYLDKNLGSQTQLDQAKVQFLQAKQAKLNTQELYEEAICQAPISGRVGLKQIEANQTIGPGSPTLQIVSSGYLDLTFGIPENLIGEYKKGSSVSVLGPEGKDIKSKLTSISALMDPQTRTFEAEVRLKNPGLPVGASVKLNAKGKNYKAQWVVPNASIINFSDANAVMLIKDNQARRTDITILASNGTQSRISGELKEGDQLVISNQHRLIDGSKVTIMEGGNKS